MQIERFYAVACHSRACGSGLWSQSPFRVAQALQHQHEVHQCLQTWYACVANAEFMLNDIQNESFAEQLREKTRFYKENDYDLDFFMVCEPEWLDKQHPDLSKKVGRPCVALVGTEENWIRYSTHDAAHIVPAALPTMRY